MVGEHRSRWCCVILAEPCDPGVGASGEHARLASAEHGAGRPPGSAAKCQRTVEAGSESCQATATPRPISAEREEHGKHAQHRSDAPRRAHRPAHGAASRVRRCRGPPATSQSRAQERSADPGERPERRRTKHDRGMTRRSTRSPNVRCTTEQQRRRAAIRPAARSRGSIRSRAAPAASGDRRRAIAVRGGGAL